MAEVPQQPITNNCFIMIYDPRADLTLPCPECRSLLIRGLKCQGRSISDPSNCGSQISHCADLSIHKLLISYPVICWFQLCVSSATSYYTLCYTCSGG